MNRTNVRIIVWSMALSAAVPCMPSALAQCSAACEDALKECMVQALEQREVCLASPATTSACTQSSLEGLLSTRVSFSTTGAQGAEGPAFLGPKAFDKSCVANFDTALTGALVKGPLSTDSITSLESSITSCAKRETPELTRP